MKRLLIITVILVIFPIMQTFTNEIENPTVVGIEESLQVTPKFSLDEKSIEAKTYNAARRTALGSIFLSYSGIFTSGFIPLSVYLLTAWVYIKIKCNKIKKLHSMNKQSVPINIRMKLRSVLNSHSKKKYRYWNTFIPFSSAWYFLSEILRSYVSRTHHSWNTLFLAIRILDFGNNGIPYFKELRL